MTSFTTSNGKVQLDGIELSDHRVDDMLDLFERKATEADKAASEARAAFNDLWDVRCRAMDVRFEKASRSLPGRDAGPVARAATNLTAI